MKTTKRTFAALLLLAALVLFGGLLAYSQDRATPTPPLFPSCTEGAHHKCVGTCPVLWTGGQNSMPVQPYVDHAHPDPCHKIQGNCTCAYRLETVDCHPPQGQGPCEGFCPQLYYDQAGNNPVPFNNHICKTDTTVGSGCACYYY
jgi:hypothetical protein